MPTIIAIFSDMKSLESAQAALRAEGHDDAVRRVIDQGAPDAEGTAPVIAGAQREVGLLDLGASAPDGGLLDGLDLPDGETDFVRDALADGARVLLLDSEDGAAVREAIRPHAQRIVPAS